MQAYYLETITALLRQGNIREAEGAAGAQAKETNLSYQE